MNPTRIAVPALLAAVVCAGATATSETETGGTAPDAPPFPGTYAFVDVHVVPLDSRRVIEHQTVLVRDGVIEAVADTGDVEIPADAQRIDGGGRYLVPGLGDMHVRLPGPEASSEEIEELLFLYVANGVTTIRQARGRRGHRTLKRRLLRDELLGPTLYVASPPLELASIREAPDSVAADSMRAAVERMVGQGWDLLRVPEGMSRREWDWMTDALARYAMAFGGPVPDSVGLGHALATGVSTVDHLDGLLEAVVDDGTARRIREAYAPAEVDGADDGADVADAAGGDAAGASSDDADPGGGDPLPRDGGGLPASDDGASEMEDRAPPVPLDSLVRAVERRKVWAVAGRARAAGAWSVPTLHLWEMRYRRRQDGTDSLPAPDLPELRYVSPDLRTAWRRGAGTAPPLDRATTRDLLATRREAARALNDLNAGLLLGTGSPGRFTVPGFSVHREMRRLEEAGIVPYEVLLAATRSVARYASSEMGESGRFGTIAPGQRADLVLVEDDPLEDLGALERRAGVMVRGRWLPAAEIERRLEEIAARHR